MLETNQNSSIDSTADIRIVGLNRDKTRKTNGPARPDKSGSGGSDAKYQVYFELSGTPSQAWRNIFEREWIRLWQANPTSRQQTGWQETVIDGRFLVMHCPLPEIALHLPVLKKAVAATNTAYINYAQEQATEQEHREDLWKNERKAVEVMAESLHFE